MIELLRSIASTASVVLRRDAIAVGIDDNALRRYVDAGLLQRIRQGAYAEASAWRDAGSAQRHLMLIDAVMRQYDDHVALSHASSVIVQRGPAWGLDLSNVHLTHLHGGGRNSAGIVHHHGSCRVPDLTRVDGHWITSPARTVHDLAMTSSPEATLVHANDVLHRGLATLEEIRYLEPARNKWPRTLGMNVVHHLADPRIESVLESRASYLFWTQGLPTPVPQLEVLHPDGHSAGRVDFAWPEHRVYVELDGGDKYLRYRRDGESLEDFLMREKRRQDTICELTGWRVIRLTWADIARPVATAARIRVLLGLAA